MLLKIFDSLFFDGIGPQRRTDRANDLCNWIMERLDILVVDRRVNKFIDWKSIVINMLQ